MIAILDGFFFQFSTKLNNAELLQSRSVDFLHFSFNLQQTPILHLLPVVPRSVLPVIVQSLKYAGKTKMYLAPG